MKYIKIFVILLSIISIFSISFAQENKEDEYGYMNELQQLYKQQVNINQASLEEIMEIKGLSEEQAESIYEWRQTRGFFQSIYTLLKVPGIDIDTFNRIKYKIRIQVPEETKSYTLQRIANLQSRLAAEDGAPTEIAIDEWEDLLLDPMNINAASVDNILVLGNVTPVDAAAIIRRRESGSAIKDLRSLRSTPGLTNYGYRNIRDYVTYSPPDEKWAFRGNLRLKWNYISNIENEEFGPEEQITALQTQINELDYANADTTLLGYTLIDKHGWTEGEVDSLRNKLRKQQKELDKYRSHNGTMVQKFRARLGRKIQSGLIFEKDNGEEKYTDLRKGYLAFNDFGDADYKLNKLIIGHYRLAFGQSLIMDNADERRDRTTDRVVGLYGDATTTEQFSLFGAAVQNSIWRFNNIFFYSKDKKDAILNPDGSVNSLIVTDYQLSTIKDKVEEETYGANIRFDLGDVGGFMPYGTYVGFTTFTSSYDREINPIPETLDIPDYPTDGKRNQLIDKNYTNLWSGNKRRIFGGEFRTILDNFSLEGEYAKLQDATNDDGNAYVIKARALYEHLYLLAIYRHYDLDYDNPYARPFAEQAKFDDTLLEKDYRLMDPTYRLLEEFPTPKAEEGIYLETRYEISRKLTITKLYADMWKNLAYNLPNLRVQGEIEYRPVFPLRFRLKHKYQRKQRGRNIVPSKSITNETTFRVFALITQRDFFQLKLRYGKVDLTSVPSLSGEDIEERYMPRSIDMDGGFIEVSWDHNFSEDLSVQGGIMYWNTNGMSQWNFEDDTIDFLNGRGKKYYVVVSDRLSPNVQLRLKFRNLDSEQPHTGLLTQKDGNEYGYHYATGEYYKKNDLIQKINLFSLQIQLDYRW